MIVGIISLQFDSLKGAFSLAWGTFYIVLNLLLYKYLKIKWCINTQLFKAQIQYTDLELDTELNVH